MIDFPGQQDLPLFGSLALGDVDGDAAQPITRPRSSKLAAAVPMHQRISPFGRRTRNSV